VLLGGDHLDLPAGAADVVILANGAAHRPPATGPGPETGRFVEIIDAATLDEACAAARRETWSVLRFRDPTKIPLEIVIAAAAGAPGRIMTVAADLQEAAIIFGVLEHGPAGVMMAPQAVGDATALKQAAARRAERVELAELEVTAVTHTGMGERACVDTCTYLRPDEGILAGSHSKGMILCVSETHPLPYMPTRPFRVNAGALHSYVLGPDNRTNYLSELHSGSTVLAVNTEGRTRRVVVGRAKLESRPLLQITAHSQDGVEVSLTVQDDWHVRVLGPGPKVRNVTELARGDELLGYIATDKRHVGIPIGEFCKES
jgi:3-amino-4-hydroxybenzoic acid synthase